MADSVRVAAQQRYERSRNASFGPAPGVSEGGGAYRSTGPSSQPFTSPRHPVTGGVYRGPGRGQGSGPKILKPSNQTMRNATGQTRMTRA